jgi:hypothetical protein
MRQRLPETPSGSYGQRLSLSLLTSSISDGNRDGNRQHPDLVVISHACSE